MLKTNYYTQIHLANDICSLIINEIKLYKGINRNYYCYNSTPNVAGWKIYITQFDEKTPPKKINILKSKFFHSYYIQKKTKSAYFFYRKGILFTSRFFFILKCLILDLFINNEILFLHASGIKKNDKALIFTAAAHKGKSTIARLSKLPILADDGIILKKINGIYYTFPSIFEKKKKVRFNFKKTRLDKIYLLQKSLKNLILNAGKEEAFKGIYSNLLINRWETRKTNKKLILLIFDLLSKVKVKYLYFNRDPEYLNYI